MNKQRGIRALLPVPGRYEPGPRNAISDVEGVKVGHYTLNQGNDIHTGITVIQPHDKNAYQYPVPCAVFCGNGFGKLTGSMQVEELGILESMIGLTNTLSVPMVMQGLIEHYLRETEEPIVSINTMVGETNDSILNNIRRLTLTSVNVQAAIDALSDQVPQGCVGAGAGTCCYGYKGGIGTASRVVPLSDLGEYIVGALVQANFSGNLNIYGHPAHNGPCADRQDGSCMIIVATDAPVNARQLKRIAKRGILGMAYTGSHLANGSGDFCVAFSNCTHNISARSDTVQRWEILSDSCLNPLFEATVEAVREAVYNSLALADDTTGYDGTFVPKFTASCFID